MRILFKKILSTSLILVMTASMVSVNSLAKDNKSSNTEADFDLNSVLVVMSGEKDVSNEDLKKQFASTGIKSITSLDLNTVSNKNERTKHMKFELKNKSKAGVLKAIKALKSKPGVLIAEPNYIMNKCATTPNDEYYYAQSNMRLISADKAWDITKGSPSITVGIIDSGILIDNKDLYPNMWTNTNEINGNYIDDDGNGYIDDYFGYNFAGKNSDCYDDDGHGTKCAGLVAAKGNNYSQIAGVSWDTRIACLRIQDQMHRSASIADMVEAINYASKMEIQILNISMGNNYYSQMLYDAIKAYPGLVVASAGNDSLDNDSSSYPNYPASYDLDNIISVASTNHSDVLAPDSNYGMTTVDLSAPGEKLIWSTGYGNTSESFSGTSAAAPQVSGAAALIMAYRPSYSVADVKKAILSNVDVVSSLAGRVATSGRLNVYKALVNELPDNEAPTATDLTVENASGSHAPWPAGINLQGETCINSNMARITLKGVKDRSGVQGVRFHLIGHNLSGVCTQDYIYNGAFDSQGNYYVDVDMSSLPEVNYYKLQAFPVDSKGNSQESTMLWNNSYTWQKSVKYDASRPSASASIWGTNGSWFTAGTSDGNPATNSTGISVRVNASENLYSGAGIKSVVCHLFKGTTLVQTKTAENYNPDAIGNGTYETAFDYSSLVSQDQEIKFTTKITIIDFANNTTILNNGFTYDTLSPRGTLSLGAKVLQLQQQ